MLIRTPNYFLKPEIMNQYTEHEFEQIYNYLLTHRMTDTLLQYWIHDQKKEGYWKYKAIGQLFGRYATIGRGYSTIEKALIIKQQQQPHN